MEDIKCWACEEELGWKYVEAYVSGEKHKEGKYVLSEKLLRFGEPLWDQDEEEEEEVEEEEVQEEKVKKEDIEKGDMKKEDHKARVEDVEDEELK